MAKAASRASALTTLKIGQVEVGVGLYQAHADPKKKLVEFDTAGPSGGALMMREVARPTPVGETVDQPDQPVGSDPLAVDPGRETPEPWSEQHVSVGAAAAAGDQVAKEAIAVAGEYGRELVEEGTGEVVPPENVRRGVRLEDGAFVDCSAQIAKIDRDTKLEKMEVLRGGMLAINHVPRARMKGAYYLAPADEKAPPALRLIYEALKRTQRSALVKLTKRSRQTLGVITVRGETLMLCELVWAEDFREPPARAKAIQKVKVSEAQVEQAVELVRAYAGPPTMLDELRDDAIQLREELHAKALRGEIEAEAADVEAAEQDDELMSQLEASLAAVA